VGRRGWYGRALTLLASALLALPAVAGLEDLPDTDNPELQFEMGRAYLGGEGVEKDPAKANEWFRRAAEQGHAKAQLQLGLSYRRGRGVPQDLPQSIEWLTKAADAGHPKAQLELGIAYRDGIGVAKDPVRAALWLGLSARAGSPAASVMLPPVRGALDEKQRAEVKRLTDAWRAKREEGS
jgi:hypothetical protein